MISNFQQNGFNNALFELEPKGVSIMDQQTAFKKSLNTNKSKIPQKHSGRTGRDKPKGQRRVLSGDGISPGIAYGRAFLYTDILTRDLDIYNIKKRDVAEEMGRIHAAFDQVLDDLGEHKKFIESQSDHFNAAIFDFHKEVLKDKQLNLDLAEELESQLINAEIVVRNIFRKLAEKLRLSDNDIISSKADDIEDLGKRILRVLVGYEANILESLPPDSIVVAKRLLPSDTVHVKRESLKGIVVEEGSTHSHSALLARTFGISAIANVKELSDHIRNGDELLLDGKYGHIIIHPTDEDIQKYNERKNSFSVRIDELAEKRNEPVLTKCGKTIKIYANAYSERDFKQAYENGCDGIGLFRMEQLYMSYKTLPDEEVIFNQLDQTFKHLPDKEITVRLLDIGGDKNLPYLNQKKERNPFLGLRGIRFLLKHKNLMISQLRAILKLSEIYPLRLMIPMVTLSDEIRAVKNALKECMEKFEKEEGKIFPDLPVGAMIETPAAALSASKIAEHVDFLSIGTNDLMQYIMAAGRENVNVQDYYEKGIDLIMEIIEDIVIIGSQKKIEVNVCGEIAGNLTRTEGLLHTGLECFSVSPYIIPELKEKISQVSLEEVK